MSLVPFCSLHFLKISVSCFEGFGNFDLSDDLRRLRHTICMISLTHSPFSPDRPHYAAGLLDPRSDFAPTDHTPATGLLTHAAFSPRQTTRQRQTFFFPSAIAKANTKSPQKHSLSSSAPSAGGNIRHVSPSVPRDFHVPRCHLCPRTKFHPHFLSSKDDAR